MSEIRIGIDPKGVVTASVDGFEIVPDSDVSAAIWHWLTTQLDMQVRALS